MITVCICESQPILVEGLRGVLERNKDFQFLGAATNISEAACLVTECTPRVCVIDNVFGSNMISQFISEIRQRSPKTQLVLWTDDIVGVESFRALQAGFRGILKKTLPAQAALDCFWAVGHGNLWIEKSISCRFVGFINKPSDRLLADREQQILELIMCSKTNKEIAGALGISVGTVKVHLFRMFEKAGVTSRLQLALYGLQWRGVLLPASEKAPLPAATPGSGTTVKTLPQQEVPAWAGLAWQVEGLQAPLQAGASA